MVVCQHITEQKRSDKIHEKIDNYEDSKSTKSAWKLKHAVHTKILQYYTKSKKNTVNQIQRNADSGSKAALLARFAMDDGRLFRSLDVFARNE